MKVFRIHVTPMIMQALKSKFGLEVAVHILFHQE